MTCPGSTSLSSRKRLSSGPPEGGPYVRDRYAERDDDRAERGLFRLTDRKQGQQDDDQSKEEHNRQRVERRQEDVAVVAWPRQEQNRRRRQSKEEDRARYEVPEDVVERAQYNEQRGES